MPKVQDRAIVNLANFGYHQPLSGWFGHTATDVRLAFYRSSMLHGDNAARLASIYGPPHQTYAAEVRNRVWRTEHEGLGFWVFSSKGGTSFAVEAGDRGEPISFDAWSPYEVEQIHGFLDDLFRRLHACQPGWMPQDWAPPEDAVLPKKASEITNGARIGTNTP